MAVLGEMLEFGGENVQPRLRAVALLRDARGPINSAVKGVERLRGQLKTPAKIIQIGNLPGDRFFLLGNFGKLIQPRALERFEGIAFLQSYGMTELSPVATMLPVRIAAEKPRARRARKDGTG